MLNKEKNNADFKQMQFDKGWWDFILSDEPVVYKKKETADSEPIVEILEDGNNWTYIENIYQSDIVIDVEVYGINKGGLLASGENIKGFIPVSHILFDENPKSPEHLDEMLKKKIGVQTHVKVIECNPYKNKVVLSERAAQTENGERKELISAIKSGAILKGRVTNITDFGVFVDLGGIEGLVHISELSWGRVRSPSNFVKIDEMVSVLVLSVEENDMHVALSIKRLIPNPWFEIERRYKPGDVVKARIVNILPYGAFVCLEEGIEGLIHISTLKMNDKISDLNQVFEKGKLVKVEIIHIDVKKHRLGLALVDTG